MARSITLPCGGPAPADRLLLGSGTADAAAERPREARSQGQVQGEWRGHAQAPGVQTGQQSEEIHNISVKKNVSSLAAVSAEDCGHPAEQPRVGAVRGGGGSRGSAPGQDQTRLRRPRPRHGPQPGRAGRQELRHRHGHPHPGHR